MHDHILELSHINLHAVCVSLCHYSRKMSRVMDRSVTTGVLGADQSGRGYSGGSPTTVQAWLDDPALCGSHPLVTPY